MKRYKCGLFLGRFQPLHQGHVAIITKMLEDCEKIIIAIGSAQEMNTATNPFRYEYRRLMIQKVFPTCYDRIYIVGITDRVNPSDDESWGEYLLSTIYKNTGAEPDVIYQGVEQKHCHWFDSININIVNIDRELVKVSATDIRKALLENNIAFCSQFMPEALHSEFENLKEVLKNVSTN